MSSTKEIEKIITDLFKKPREAMVYSREIHAAKISLTANIVDSREELRESLSRLENLSDALSHLKKTLGMFYGHEKELLCDELPPSELKNFLSKIHSLDEHTMKFSSLIRKRSSNKRGPDSSVESAIAYQVAEAYVDITGVVIDRSDTDKEGNCSYKLFLEKILLCLNYDINKEKIHTKVDNLTRKIISKDIKPPCATPKKEMNELAAFFQ